MMRRPHAPTVPHAIEEITPEWLTAALRQGGILRSTHVRAVEASVIGDEHGFTGVVARLQVAYGGGPAGPASIVAKLPTANRVVESSYRRRLGTGTAARHELAERAARELRFLAHIGARHTTPAPRLLHGAVDGRRGAVALLLEDVRGARQADLLAGMSAAEARAVLRAMADFHAGWWGRAEQVAEWLPRWGGDAAERQERYARRAATFLARHARSLPHGAANVVRRLVTGYERVIRGLAGGPSTIIHGDLHADNVLLRGPAAEPSAVVLDWQTVARGPAAVDVSLLLVSSLTTAERRANEEQLLDEYWQRLVAGGVTGYERADLWHDYRAATMWQLAGTVGWLALVEPATLSGRERLIVERLISEPRVFEAALESESAVLDRG